MAADPIDVIAFIQVVDHGGFRAAADALKLPRATVSRRVKRLEAQLGVRLLNRTTRSVGLTEAGQVLFQRTRGLKGMLDDAEDNVRQLDGKPRGLLRVASSVAFAQSWLTHLIPRFFEVCPDVQVDLAVSHRNVDLIKTDTDVALRLGALPSSSYYARRIATFTTRMFASPEYLARHGSPGEPEELTAHHVLATRLAEKPEGYAWRLRKGDTEREFQILPTLVTDDPTFAVGAALNGGGIVLTIAEAMTAHVKAGRLELVLPAWTGPHRDLHVVFPNGPGQLPKVQVFVDFLTREIRGN